MAKATYTDGSEVTFRDTLCDCGLTGGCKKCNPFYKYWKEDVEMAELGMEEYYENLLLIDEPEIPLDKTLIRFYKKKGYV